MQCHEFLHVRYLSQAFRVWHRWQLNGVQAASGRIPKVIPAASIRHLQRNRKPCLIIFNMFNHCSLHSLHMFRQRLELGVPFPKTLNVHRSPRSTALWLHAANNPDGLGRSESPSTAMPTSNKQGPKATCRLCRRAKLEQKKQQHAFTVMGNLGFLIVYVISYW